MRKWLTFILIFFTLTISAQTEYKPKVAWKTVVDSVGYVSLNTYIVKVEPIDYNDPGAIQRIVSGYLMDNIGHVYTVIDSTSTTITVTDDFGYGISPVAGKKGWVFQSVGDGTAPYIAPVMYEPLDSKAKDNTDKLFNDILWRQANLYAQDSAQIQFDSDTLIWDATKHDLLNFKDSLPEFATLQEALIGVDSANIISPLTNKEVDILINVPYYGALEDIYSEYNITVDTLISTSLQGTSIRAVAVDGDGRLIDTTFVFDDIELLRDSVIDNINRIYELSDSVAYLYDWNYLQSDTLIDLSNRLTDIEGFDTTGIYHWNRPLLDKIGSDDTLRWNLFSEWDKDYFDLINLPNITDSINTYQTDDQQLSIDSTNRVFTILLENGGSVKFEDTNTTYDLSGYATRSELHDTANVLRSEFPTLLTELDSTGFRITESQISDLQDYLTDSDLTVIENTLATHSDSFEIAFDSLSVHRVEIDNLKTEIDSVGNIPETDPIYSSDSANIVWFDDLDYFTNADETDPEFYLWLNNVNFQDSVLTYQIFQDLTGIRDTLEFHRDSIRVAYDSIVNYNIRLLDVEGLDTTGIYHANRDILDAITSGDTTRWGSKTNLDYATIENAQVGENDYKVMTPLTDAEQIELNAFPYYGAKEDIYTNHNITGDSIFANYFNIDIEGIIISTSQVTGYEYQVTNEVPEGSINGSNDTFTTDYSFISNSTEVFLNGVKQILGTNYIEGSGQIIFNTGYIPYSGDLLTINYRR